MISHSNLPGYGDAATWGPVNGPGDPRWEPQPFSGSTKVEVYLEDTGEEFLVDYQGYDGDIEIVYCDPDPTNKSTMDAIKEALEEQL